MFGSKPSMARGTAATMPFPPVMPRLWDQPCPAVLRVSLAPGLHDWGSSSRSHRSQPASSEQRLCPGLKQPPVFPLKDLILN